MQKVTRALATILLVLSISTASMGGDMPMPGVTQPAPRAQTAASDPIVDEGAVSVSEGLVASIWSYASAAAAALAAVL